MSDANADKYSLLIGGDGSANGATVVNDYSSASRQVTVSGDAKFDSSRQLFGKSTLTFDQVGDYLSLAPEASVFSPPGDFTIIARVFQTNASGGGALFAGTSYQSIVGNNQFGVGGNSSLALYLGSGKPGFDIYQGGANKSINAASAISLNGWHELMGVRSGNTIYLLVDGALVGSAGVSAGGTDISTRNLRVAADGSANGLFAGSIAEVALLSGVALHTGAYTVPADYRLAGIPRVSGTVHDASGSPVARTLRAYRRDTGALVGKTISNADGTFTLYAATTSAEIDVVCLDDDAGSFENDLISRVIPA